MSTAEERLAEVSTAITKILVGGQSYKIGTRSLTRADLAELRAMKKELEQEVAAENTPVLGRKAAAAFFDRR